MISVVFDCMLFLQAMTSERGPAAACLDWVDSGHVELLLSTAILEELRGVLLRPSTRKHFPLLTEEKAERFLAKVTALAVVMDDVPVTMRLPRDPKDEPYLNLALTAKANFLVSWDHDLLSLMNDGTFRKKYHALAIVDPPAFLRHVRTTGKQQAA
jgi:putative PIN family toxin of toxin-antitoxin system